MVTLQNGAVKYKSLKQAYEAAKRKQPDLKWMTFYMRLRMGTSLNKAVTKPVRKYVKKDKFAEAMALHGLDAA